ncbi:uncharacterized protein [Diadema antillarum]|uniref:uncharacterized protein n=1 Tax=Diadema antillarum TaxID=105358 RepID=UPI003A855A65
MASQQVNKKMQPTETKVRGRMFRIKKTCARVRLLGLDNDEARLDIAIIRRILGVGVYDMRDVFRRGASVHVDLTPMRQSPRRFQRSSSPWNVVNIMLANGEPAENATTFSNPAAYFAGKKNMQIPFTRSKPLVKPEMTGRVVEVIWKIFAEAKETRQDVEELLGKLKKVFSKDELRVLHSESKTLLQRFRRFFMTIPLFFTMRWGKEEWSTNIFLHPGFTELAIQKEIRRRALVIYKRRGGGRKSDSRSEASDLDDSLVELDVTLTPGKATTTTRIPVVSEAAKCAVVVDTLLKDAAKTGMMVISLDCKGSPKDGQTSVTLVQLSTLEGEIWLFDVSECPGKSSLMKEGRLKELLEADIVMKVMHDCRIPAANLHRQFGVKLRNVFDTSLAYDTLLYQCNLLPSEQTEERPRIEMAALCELLGEKAQSDVGKGLTETLENNPHMWADRPLSEELIQYAAGTVRSLVPRVFNKLDRLIHPAWQQYFDWRCEHTLLHTQTAEE